ncbi:hypothetical protein [Streptomyces fungicidicus]
MPKAPPDSMQHHLGVRLNSRAKERWQQLARVDVRFRTGFAYVSGELKDGDQVPLFRLPFTGVLHTWGFASYLASRGTYRDNSLPTGLPFGSPEDCLDCACYLYLSDQPA